MPAVGASYAPIKYEKARPGYPNLAFRNPTELIALAPTATAKFPTATTTTAAAALFTRPCFADRQVATIDRGAIQRGNRALGFLRRTHRHEAKTAGAAAHAINHQVGFHDGAVRGKSVL